MLAFHDQDDGFKYFLIETKVFEISRGLYSGDSIVRVEGIPFRVGL